MTPLPRLAPLLLAPLLAATLLTACAAPPPPPATPAPGSAAAPVFGDFKPHPWDWRSPASYPVHGIDVARFQTSIDWAAARAAGVSFAYIKATEGGDLLDPMFHDHRKGARRAGVRYGAYHFYYFCRSAEDQARWFIRNVPRDANALPHVLDMEWNPHSPTCLLRPPDKVVRDEARHFLDILERHYGRRPIVYTTPDFYRDTGINRLRGTEFWLRSVANHPSVVYPGQSWTFWQYTGTGQVPGIKGPVDINVFHGSPEEWLRWAR